MFLLNSQFSYHHYYLNLIFLFPHLFILLDFLYFHFDFQKKIHFFLNFHYPLFHFQLFFVFHQCLLNFQSLIHYFKTNFAQEQVDQNRYSYKSSLALAIMFCYIRIRLYTRQCHFLKSLLL